jgi:hypothetical protein
MEALALWIILSAVAGIVASSRGRNGPGFFVLSLVLSPLVGLLLAALLPSRQRRVAIPGPEDLDTPARINCPRCAESIAAAAKVCRFCGHELRQESAHTPMGDNHPQPEGLSNKLAAAAGRMLAGSDKSHRFPPQ